MSNIKFISFDHVDPNNLIVILNEDALRTHLIDHPSFDTKSIQRWMEDKKGVDAIEGCRVCAVFIDGELAGWCGIQPDDKGFELAIVLSQRFWGNGIAIFNTLMLWAKELGHSEVLFHLLDSRPENKALYKMATKVSKTQLSGRYFTTYYIPVL